MDFGRSFSYVLDDQDWFKKILIGSLINVVPVLNFAAMGYSLEVTRRVIQGDLAPLPEWEDIGDKLIKGLFVAIIQLVYILPILLLSCIMSVPMMFLGDPSMGEGGGGMGGLVVILSTCLSCLSSLYGLFVGLVLPAAIAHYAVKGELAAAFRFNDILSLVRKNIGVYLFVLLIICVVTLLAGLVGGLACGVGLIVTVFYAMLVSAYAYGQAYREASANIGLI
jgi:hypothetical protein